MAGWIIRSWLTWQSQSAERIQPHPYASRRV
jgi:hypothetical protein